MTVSMRLMDANESMKINNIYSTKYMDFNDYIHMIYALI